MFQFPAFASLIQGMTGLQPAGLSHSETSGSRAVCASPELIAAYRVLHRLREPRHPPYALSCLFAAPASPQGGVCWKMYFAGSRAYCAPEAAFACLICFLLARFLLSRFCVSSPLGSENRETEESHVLSNMSKIIRSECLRRLMVENIGVEPMTSCMPCKRSSQLS